MPSTHSGKPSSRLWTVWLISMDFTHPLHYSPYQEALFALQGRMALGIHGVSLIPGLRYVSLPIPQLHKETMTDWIVYIGWVISTRWENAEDDKKIIAWHTKLVSDLHAQNKRRGVALDFLYYNDCHGGQDAFSTFPDANLRKMRKIRKKYDPELVFTKLVPGGFKIDGKKHHY